MTKVLGILLVGLAAPALLMAQSTTDEDLAKAAAERGRLGNTRIQTEMERRLIEEQELQEASQQQQQASATAQQTSTPTPPQTATQPAPAPRLDMGYKPLPAPAPVTSRPAATPAAASPARSGDLTRILQQLQALGELGELKDRGYVTEEEFRRIKSRILDDG